MLRPLGTIFKTEYPPSLNCTETRWTRITYQVTKHIDVIVDRAGNTRPMEQAKAIDIEYFEKPIVYKIRNGRLRIEDRK